MRKNKIELKFQEWIESLPRGLETEIWQCGTIYIDSIKVIYLLWIHKNGATYIEM